jgi:hypothetical protein
VRGAAAVTAPSTDASMKSRSEMAMGSTGEKADDPPAPINGARQFVQSS